MNNVQYGFYFDSDKCSGCKTCHIACKDRMVDLLRSSSSSPANGVDTMKGVIWRRVYEFGGGSWVSNGAGGYSNTVFARYTSISCNHCSNPVCVKACPTGAMHKRKDNGLVSISKELCIGCESCAKACPYDAPQLDKATKTMTKCDGCIDRLQQGKKPVCVDACSLRALDFDTIENLEAKYGKGDGHIAPLPSQSITHPNLIYRANSNTRIDGKVLNPNEV